MRGIARRLRSSFGIRSTRMTIRAQLAWYWRWLLYVLLSGVLAGIVWWAIQNSHHITGFNFEEARQRITTLGNENETLKRDLETARTALTDRERVLQIEKAAQGELARTVAQLQDENAVLKEDLGFLRNIMSSGTTPEGIGLSNLKVEAGARPQEYRYRMILTQGGQRRQDFKGRVQLVAKIDQRSGPSTITVPDSSAGEAAGAVEFRFYQKVEGQFRIPEGSVLKGVDVRVLQMPGGQVKLSRSLNLQ